AYGIAGILGPVAGGILFDVTQQYILAFIFAGLLCFVASGCSVVVWGLAMLQTSEATQQTAPSKPDEMVVAA
ncbi:MAG: hypothetical protein AAFV33_26830, partial [Chloroflexota bacterium]